MPEHYTPNEIITKLTEYIPSKINSLLEPAVGGGSLLFPFINRKSCNLNKIVCLDINNSILKHVRRKYRKHFGDKLNIINKNFLEWSSSYKRKNMEEFDFIIMNPPFSGSSKNLVEIDIGEELGVGNKKTSVPLEIAFLLKAINLLKKDGTLIAIMPSSFISSNNTDWLRKAILELGAVKEVVEFPKLTFPGVEARTYIFIFLKGQKHKSVKLKSYLSSHSISINGYRQNHLRFDYSYHNAINSIKTLTRRHKNMDWSPLGNFATIIRGTVNTPFNGTKAIHTTDFLNGIWKCKDDKNGYLKSFDNRSIMKNDLIVKRVGRNCSETFGMAFGLEGHACSDCILIIRPNELEMGQNILLAIRLIAFTAMGKELLENGSGAKYITMSNIRNLLIPIGIAKNDANICKQYGTAIKNQDVKFMSKIEQCLKIKYKLV